MAKARAALRLAAAASLAVLLSASAPQTGDPGGADAKSRFLTGQLLVAAPEEMGGWFARTVVLMVKHDIKGAFGLVVNRPIGKITAGRLLQQLGNPQEDVPAPEVEITLHAGGPVARTRVFVIHSTDFEGKETKVVNPSVAVTTSPDVLRAIATGKGPKRSILALGYSGWGPGQLEGELKRDGWVVAPFDRDIVLDGESETKWRRALGRRGVDL